MLSLPHSMSGGSAAAIVVHTFSFISLMSEYVLKTQTLPFRSIPCLSWYYFLLICLFFVQCFLFFKKYYTSFAHFPFLYLLLLRLDILLLAFRDGRNISMLTQSILPSSFIIIQKQKTYILYPKCTLSFIKLRCECAIVVLLPKYSFLFVFFYSDTRVTFKTQRFPLIHFLSLWNGRHFLFHSETKYTSYSPTTPFQSFKIIHFEAYNYLFSIFHTF